MKAPTMCPVCGDAMLNTFPPAEELNDRMTKSCIFKLNHKVVMIVKDDEVDQMSIDLGNGYEAIFLFFMKHIWVQPTRANKTGAGHMVLPFFEPNLSDYKKLVNKIKTYMVFS